MHEFWRRHGQCEKTRMPCFNRFHFWLMCNSKSAQATVQALTDLAT
jgi:hypothetical protein